MIARVVVDVVGTKARFVCCLAYVSDSVTDRKPRKRVMDDLILYLMVFGSV